jgi:hypothetical protein
MHWEILEHLAYSVDLSPLRLPHFGPLKQAFKEFQFQSGAQVEEATGNIFQKWLSEFFKKGI